MKTTALLAAPSTNSATATPPKVSLSAGQLASKTGLYRNPSTEALGRIFLRDGKLRASGDSDEGESVELTPVGENRFVIRGTAIAVEFVPAANGRAQELHETGIGPKPIVSQKLDAFAPSSTELRAFAGTYTSPEVDVTYTITMRGSELVIQMPGRSDVVLRPIYPDAFVGAVVNVVKFSHDASGVVTGFSVNASGARRLRFDQVTR